MTAAERATIRGRYGLPLDRSVVLYATQPVLWRRVLTHEQLEANVRTIAAAVSSVPGRPLLAIKLHPRETTEQYRFCESITPPIRLIPNAEMADLIAASDVFVSSSSSTVLLAMMLDRPIVTVNFNQVPHFDFFEKVGGSLHTRTAEEFDAAIRRALLDESTKDLLARGRAEGLARYTRFDGRATERIAGLIHSSITWTAPHAAAG